jgi:hypothetical protein
MDASTRDDLSRRLDAVVEEADTRVKDFRSKAESEYREVRERFQTFLPIASRIAEMAREKLERLRERIKFEVTPANTQTEQLYVRSVVLNVKSELAGVIRLSLKLTHTADVSHILLDYDLEIIPVFFRFEPHARLDVPLADYDEAAVGKWLDDRIIDFANAYVELHATKQYQERVMVSDTVAGIRFPKYFAAASCEHGGSTYYFISDETRREFEKRHGLTS